MRAVYGDDDLADGFTPDDAWPDDAWLAALFAEGEALFGERDRQCAPGAPVELERWPVEALAGTPGAELAWVVEGYTGPGAAAEAGSTPLAALSDDLLGELVGACARLQSWAAGVQARAVGERVACESSPLAHDSLVGQVTAELVVTQAEGSEVVVRAESGAEHPTVITALVTGRIDVRKAHTLLRSAADLTVAERAEAIARYLPQAPYRTWRWLRNKLLAFAKARHGSAETARIAAEARNVQVDRAENDMGWLSAYLPAVDAAAVWGVVDDMAHQLRYTAGEERTLGQLRADCLTGIVTGRLVPADRFAATGVPGSGSADRASAADGGVCTCGGRAPVVQESVVRVTPTRPVVRVTVPASTLLGLDDAPGELDGFGPVPAETVRLIAKDATWRRLVTDPVTGVLVDYSSQAYTPGKVLRAAVEARDGTCTFLGCDTPAMTCDLDHIEPFDHECTGRTAAAAASNGARGQTSARNLHALCRRHHLLKTHAGWGVERDPVTGITTWTTPAGRTHVRPPTVLDTRVDLDLVDPGTSHDLTLRALTRRRLPRAYAAAASTTERVPAAGTDAPSGLGDPPF
ncbi:HNH endonuclease [Promicromonospora sp. NPDC090134]|uniref:HNH endonuclease signature motif containing protein n=1 Tax=Promicromonospora sp. NPDC090134 TaxID=3364408 RepID=UPI0037FB461C